MLGDVFLLLHKPTQVSWLQPLNIINEVPFWKNDDYNRFVSKTLCSDRVQLLYIEGLN